MKDESDVDRWLDDETIRNVAVDDFFHQRGASIEVLPFTRLRRSKKTLGVIFR
jgi:hypothetical protein